MVLSSYYEDSNRLGNWDFVVDFVLCFFWGGQKSITGLILPFHRANNLNLTMMTKQHYLLALLRAADFPRKKKMFLEFPRRISSNTVIRLDDQITKQLLLLS